VTASPAWYLRNDFAQDPHISLYVMILSIDQHTSQTSPLSFQNALDRGHCVGTAVFLFIYIGLLKFLRVDRYLEDSTDFAAAQRRGGGNVFVRNYDKCRKEAVLPIDFSLIWFC
jgi:hypothetical protein